MAITDKTSGKRFVTIVPELQKLFTEVDKEYPCTALCGHRNKADQDKAFKAKKSKAEWPKSQHNYWPSRALDVVPLTIVDKKNNIDYENDQEFQAFAEIVFRIADQQGIHVTWGGDFNMDGSKTQSDAWDKAHWQLAVKKADKLKKG